MVRARKPSPAALALPLLAAISCEFIAELDGKTFVGGFTSGGTSSGASSGGTSARGGAPAGASGEAASGAGAAAGVGPGAPGGEGGSGTSGAGGADGGQGGQGCVDVEAELCMRPTWPEGTVPYAVDSGSELVLAAVRDAFRGWEGKPVGSTVLRFVEDPIPNVKTLRFTLDGGCRPTALSDESVNVAIGGCTERRDIARAIGVALGLPSMHRRGNRDRYLVMADAGEFSCEDGTFFETCSDRDGVPATLGPFDYGSVMFAPSTAFDACVLEPNADRLYSPRAAFDPPEAVCGWASGAGPFAGSYDDGALTELYAISEGWSPLELVGVDPGPQQLIDACLGTESFRSAPALVATGNGGLAAFALAGESLRLWSNENDGQSWSRWEELTPLPELHTFPAQFAAAARDDRASVIDAVVVDQIQVFHVSYDRARREASTFTNLGAPPGAELGDVAVAPSGVGGAFVYVLSPASFTSSTVRIFVRSFHGAVWSEWEALPALDDSGYGWSIGALLIEGRQHVVAGTTERLWHIERANAWSNWNVLELPPFDGARFSLVGLSLVTNAHYRLGVLGSADAGPVFTGCSEWPCLLPDAWSKPLALGAAGSLAASTPDRIDIVTTISEMRPATPEVPCFDGMWHKRWQAPER
jgi:hypothetical protein